MTITVQAITASIIPVRYSLTGVTKVASAYTVHGLSKDRNWLFGSGASAPFNVLSISNDDASTWNPVGTFNFKGDNTEVVQGVMEMPDGEICVGTGLGTGFPSYIYKSSGWGTTLAQHQAATFTKVCSLAGGSFVDVWGFNQKGCGNNGGSNGKAVCSVYNGSQTQTSNPTTELTRPRYVYMTLDSGATWNMIYDVMVTPNVNGTSGVHMHCCDYHEAFDRVWLTIGDASFAQPIAGAGNCLIGYGDGPNYSTITYLPWPTIINNTSYAQFTSIYADTASVMFVPDNAMAIQMQPIMTLPITGYRTFGNARLNPVAPTNAPYGKALQRAGAGFPLLQSSPQNPGSGLSAAAGPTILCSPDNVNWYPLYTDPAPASTNSGFYGPITGPSLRGKIITQYEGGLLIGTLSGPA